MRQAGFLAIAGAAVLVTGLHIAPARADADDRYGWRQHQQREEAWRRDERRENAARRDERQEQHRWYPAYYNNSYYRWR